MLRPVGLALRRRRSPFSRGRIAMLVCSGGLSPLQRGTAAKRQGVAYTRRFGRFLVQSRSWDPPSDGVGLVQLRTHNRPPALVLDNSFTGGCRLLQPFL